jgi:lipopolysaccharide transport system permease protein
VRATGRTFQQGSICPVSDGSSGSSGFVDRATERSSLIGMVRGVIRYRELIRNLVLRDLHLKYRGSILGFLWSLLNPVVMVGASTMAFKYILRVGQARYVFFVLVGVLAWSFFANASNMSTRSMIDSAGLLKSVRFPRAVLPVATVLFNTAQYLLTIVVLLPIMFLFYGLPPLMPMLSFPVVLVLQVAFSVGIAMVLSVATVYFRDIRHLVEVSLSFLFWATPVLYSLSQVSGRLRTIIAHSPLSPFVLSYQRIFHEGLWPEPSMLLLAAGYAGASLAVGSSIFIALEDDVGEQL